MPHDQHGDQAARRDQYRAVPLLERERVALHRQALTLLRPDLATIWLATEPLWEGWPAEVSAEASWAASRGALEAPVARRPGTDAGTLVLNPRHDRDFALASSLAPFSRTVEAMSGTGQLVYARTPADSTLRVRLTAAEYAELRRTAPEQAAALTWTLPPPLIVENRSDRSRWLFLIWVFVVTIVDLKRTVGALPQLRHGSLGALLSVAPEALLIAVGVWWLSQVFQRWRRRRSAQRAVR